jgi:outer membrane protein assembly factor BamB
MKIELRTYLFSMLLLVAGMPAKADDVTKVPVGLTLDSTVVEADCQTFGRRLDNIVITPSQDYMLLEFRDLTKDGKWIKFKGDIGAYSLKESKLLWTKPFDYSNSTVTCTKAGILTARNNKVSMLDPNTGEVTWQGKFYIVQYDDSTNLVLGYSGPRSNKLSAYELTTGQQLWTVKMPHDKNWGWNHVIREDSVHWLIVADNLNRLNIRTGEVSVYEAKTGVTDVKAALLQGLVMAGGAIAGAMASGYAYFPVGVIGPNVINRLHSNVLRDDSLYYFADRQHVACLDSMMNTVWSYELPSKTSAFSQIV